MRGAPSGEGVLAFKGMPYGAPPGGAARFQEASPAEAWEGIRDTSEFGHRCPQSAEGIPLSPGVVALLSSGHDAPPISEDCLVLNVWRPAAVAEQPLPVMVWLHGGAFVAGSGSEAWYDGAALVRRGDVVLVTVNHRLGALGFLQLDPSYGPQYARSGNVGMLDLVLALRWVQDNAAAFGGDPGNVTIFGESGGGAKVSTLLAMPMAQGLFHKAVIQSGPAQVVRTPRQADAATRLVRRAARARKGDITALQAAPLDDLLAGQARALGKAARSMSLDSGALVSGFGPVLDGDVLPTHPWGDGSPALASQVPLLVGTTHDEMTLFFGEDGRLARLTRGLLPVAIAPTLGWPAAKRMVAAYVEDAPEATPRDLLVALATDLIMRRPTIGIAERRLAAGGGPVFVYQFDWVTPVLDGRLGATHALEVPFVFDNLDRAESFTGTGQERQAIADAMSEAWLAFARSGVPVHAGLPQWAAYDLEGRETMVFDETSAPKADPPGALRLAWP